MRATFAYTAARILLFAVALGLIYLAGARGLLLFALALLVSGAASYILLSRMRDNMAGSITRRIDSVRSRIDQGASVEDDQ
jgi:Mn2+/Fe2+ NRAMP family transporter